MTNYLEQRNYKPQYNGVTVECSTCGKEQHKLNFYPDKRQKNGLRQQCKLCCKSTALKRKFGISFQQYQDLLHVQGYACAICHSTEPCGTGDFHVDHDHGTNKIRGLLCSNCNTALGLFKDSQDSLLSAIQYLRKSND